MDHPELFFLCLFDGIIEVDAHVDRDIRLDFPAFVHDRDIKETRGADFLSRCAHCSVLGNAPVLLVLRGIRRDLADLQGCTLRDVRVDAVGNGDIVASAVRGQHLCLQSSHLCDGVDR